MGPRRNLATGGAAPTSHFKFCFLGPAHRLLSQVPEEGLCVRTRCTHTGSLLEERILKITHVKKGRTQNWVDVEVELGYRFELDFGE